MPKVRRTEAMLHETKRAPATFGRKISRYFLYRKAKKLCSDIDREMSVFETRFLKHRFNHA